MHFRLDFYLKMFAFDSRKVCKKLIHKIRLLSVKKIQNLVDFDCSAGYFLITFFPAKLWSPCLILEKSNHKLALTAKNHVLRRPKIFWKFFVNHNYLTYFTTLTKLTANSNNFWPKVTFQKRVKYRKMVFDPKPEVFPVWLGDPDESLKNKSLIILILILIIFISNFAP